MSKVKLRLKTKDDITTVSIGTITKEFNFTSVEVWGDKQQTVNYWQHHYENNDIFPFQEEINDPDLNWEDLIREMECIVDEAVDTLFDELFEDSEEWNSDGGDELREQGLI